MSSEQQPPIVEADPRGDLTLNVGNPSDDPSSSRCFLVCSRTLARISPVFDRMLYGAFAEPRGKHTAEAAWTVDLPEDPPFAFTIFVTISHGFVHKVPHSLSLDELYGLTVLTHYYDVTHILAPWASRWIASLHEPSPGSPILLAKLLWISWELGRGPLFESTARRILTEAPGSLLDPDSALHTLQMPPYIFERITAIRKQTIQAMLDVFYDLAEHLVTVDEKPRLCRHASYMGPHRCESMILGSLTFCLTRAGLWPLPEAAEVDHSISALYEIMVNLVIHDIGQPTRGDADHSSCNPRTDIMKRIKETLREMPNPVLDSHVKELDKKMAMISL
ncbi:hypothetical protein BN1723_011005 [Verticillium longisporum]|uniref:BTB domain-containing protein n=1 Tax=Verticillium longisporum TaxID=100787 RepID=A0A0G4L3C1_VERLO|nr:hypothetical protein BN1723_011005 [Verticillium longisporum]